MFDGADLPVRPLKPERVLPLAIGLGGRPWIRIHNVQWYTDSVERTRKSASHCRPLGSEKQERNGKDASQLD